MVNSTNLDRILKNNKGSASRYIVPALGSFVESRLLDTVYFIQVY